MSFALNHNAPSHLRAHAGPAGGPPVGPGRVYSVWDWVRCEYDYWYDAAGPSDAGGWMARPGKTTAPPWSAYGDPIENLLSEIPPGAVPIGRGPYAWGEVAVTDRRAAVTGEAAGAALGEGQRGYRPIMDSGLSGLGLGLGEGDDARRDAPEGLFTALATWAAVAAVSVYVVRKLVF